MLLLLLMMMMVVVMMVTHFSIQFVRVIHVSGSKGLADRA